MEGDGGHGVQLPVRVGQYTLLYTCQLHMNYSKSPISHANLFLGLGYECLLCLNSKALSEGLANYPVFLTGHRAVE